MVERLINKKQIKQQSPKYLLRQKKYKPKYNTQRNILELKDVAHHMKNYKEGMKIGITLDG